MARLRIAGSCAAIAIAAVGGFAYWNSNRGASTHPLVWSDCGGGFECARLDVPIDYDHPGGSKITLALTRFAAADPTNRIGALLVNPGGPGDSGISFARQAATSFPKEITARFDIVSFDPRGVGLSSPVLCDNPVTMSLLGVTPTPEIVPFHGRVLATLSAYGESCLRRTGDVLGFVDTTSSAHDMDQIRIALGEGTISFLGYSYGTFLGATYADLYPSHVRAFVLDGAIDPSLNYEQTQEAQALALEQALKSFLADCSSRPDCAYYNGGRAGQHFDTLVKSLDASPLVLTQALGSALPISGSSLEAAARIAFYSRSGWDNLAAALANIEFRHDGTSVAKLLSGVGGPYSQAQQDRQSAGAAISCLDMRVPDEAELIRFLDRMKAEAPHFGAEVALNGIVCLTWPVKPKGAPHDIHASGAPPIVVVGNTGDAVTPYAWAQSLARQLDASRLLTWRGYGHTAVFHNITPSCIDASVIDYLVDPTEPIATQCD